MEVQRFVTQGEPSSLYRGEESEATGVATAVAVYGTTVVIGAANGTLRHYELENYLELRLRQSTSRGN